MPSPTLRRSPKSPLPSSSSTARRTKSSTSPMAWRSLNAAPRPWSRCGWMGPGTMTLNCTASTSSAFGNSSPRSWPANATSCGAGSGAGWGFLRARPFSQRPPVPSAGGAVSLSSLSLGRWLEQTARLLRDVGSALLPPCVSPGAAGTTGRAGKRWQLAPSPLPGQMRAHPPDGESSASDTSLSPLLKQQTLRLLLAALLL